MNSHHRLHEESQDTRQLLVEAGPAFRPQLTDKPAPKDVIIKFSEHCGRCDGTEHKGHCHAPLLERVDSKHTYLYLKGPAQRLEFKNDNNRIYPKRVFEKHLTEGSEFMRRLHNREVLGELEHPDSGNTSLPRVSHIVTEAQIEELGPGNVYEVEPGVYVITEELILPTPYGQIIEAIARAGAKVGFSSRGRGDVRKEGDADLVEDNYDVDTWDAVARPSVRQARQGPKMESTMVKRSIKEQDEMPDAGGAPPPPPPMDAGGGAPPMPTGTGVEAPNILSQNTELLKKMEEIIATGDDIKDYTDILTQAIDALNQLMNAEDPETTKVRDQLLGYMKILLMKAADQMTKHGSKKKSSSSSSEKKEEPKKDEKKEKEKKEAQDMISKAKNMLAELSMVNSKPVIEDAYDDLVDTVSEKRSKDKGPVFRGEIENFLHRAGHKPDDTSVESLASAMRRKGFDVRHKQYGETQKESAGERSNPTMPQAATYDDLAMSLADRCAKQKAKIEELETKGGPISEERYEAAVTLCEQLTERNTQLQAENEELAQFNEAAVRMLHGIRSAFGKATSVKTESVKAPEKEAPKPKVAETKPPEAPRSDSRTIAEVVTERRGTRNDPLNEDTLTPESVQKLKESAKSDMTSASPDQLLIGQPNRRLTTVKPAPTSGK